MKNLQAVIEQHVRACLEEVRGEIEAEIRAVIGALATGTREKASARPAVSAGAKKPPKPRQKGSARQTRPGDSATVKPSAAATSSRRTCGCGPVGRHRRECKLATGTGPRAAKKPASDDEDRGATRPVPAARDAGPDRDDPDLVAATRAVRSSRAIEPAPELPVIPRSELTRRLVADRERAGDAGGLALKQVGPSLVGVVPGAELERRETCPLHGWVGRRQFVEGGHAQCAQLPEGAEACRVCRGRRFAQSLPCKRCDGTGIESGDRGHHAKTETTNAPPRAAEGA